jgi:PAS domain S-box-containing protein
MSRSDDNAWRMLVEEDSDGLFVIDATTYVIQWVNDKFARLFAASPEQLVGRRILDFPWDPDEFKHRPPVADVYRTGNITMSLREWRALDGTRLILEIAARAQGDQVFCRAKDLTQRGETDIQLARAEASHRVLIERLPDGIAVQRQGRIVYANSSLGKLLGYASAAELVGKRIMALVPPDERAAAAERIADLTEGRVDTVPFVDTRLLRKDGSSAPVHVGMIRVTFDAHGAVVTIARDVAEQKRLQSQLALSDRLASLGALAAGVAHEINNPLTYVLLGLDGLKGRLTRVRKAIDVAGGLGMTPTLDDMKTSLVTTLEGAKRVRRIVNDLRVFARADAEAGSPASVSSALDLALALAMHEIRHRAELVREEALDLPNVAGTDGRIAQVFLNVLVNAAQAPGTTTIRVRVAQEGEKVVVRISDNGAGIAPENLAHVFDPFFTTKTIGAGMGLGLSVCHGIVTSLGGTISVESEIGKGTTFAISLPVDDTPRAVKPPAESSPAEGEQWRILVIDDEEPITASLASALASLGQIVGATSVPEALGILSSDDAFHVVLCDVRMPDGGGIAVRDWLRANRPELAKRTVFMTGGVVDEHERAALAEALEGELVMKPFDAAELRARLGGLLG